MNNLLVLQDSDCLSVITTVELGTHKRLSSKCVYYTAVVGGLARPPRTIQFFWW